MSLWSYIQGFRSGKEANSLEREAMEDPFLAEALEGYDRVAGDHAERIAFMRGRIVRKTRRRNSFIRWGVAAGVLLALGLGGYLWVRVPSLPSGPVIAGRQPEEALPDTSAAFAEAQKERGHAKNEEDAPAEASKESMRSEMHELAETRMPDKKKTDITSTSLAEPRVEDLPDRVSEAAPVPPNVAQKELPLAEIKNMEVVVRDDLKESRLTEVQEVKTVAEEYSGDRKAYITAAGDRKLSSGNLKGTVTGARGEPLPGAVVQLAGKKHGTVTDIDGRFNLSGNKGDTLQLSFIGYENMRLPFKSDDSVTIAMKPDDKALDEVTVVAFGRQKRESVVGSAGVAAQDNRKTWEKTHSASRESFEQFVEKHLVRPDDPLCRGIKGRVVVSFGVDGQSRARDVAVKRSLCPAADAEAVRLVKEWNRWPSGEKKKTVSIKF